MDEVLIFKYALKAITRWHFSQHRISQSLKNVAVTDKGQHPRMDECYTSKNENGKRNLETRAYLYNQARVKSETQLGASPRRPIVQLPYRCTN